MAVTDIGTINHKITMKNVYNGIIKASISLFPYKNNTFASLLVLKFMNYNRNNAYSCKIVFLLLEYKYITVPICYLYIAFI
jgi:hypothetical protein